MAKVAVKLTIEYDESEYASAYGLEDGTEAREDARTHLTAVARTAANAALIRLGCDASLLEAE